MVRGKEENEDEVRTKTQIMQCLVDYGLSVFVCETRSLWSI